MGVKGEGGGGGSRLLCHLGGAAHQGGVAVVHAVEKAQGNHTFFLFQVLTPRKSFLLWSARPGSAGSGRENPPPGHRPDRPRPGPPGRAYFRCGLSFPPAGWSGSGPGARQNRRPPAAAGQRDLPPPVPAPASPPGPGQSPPTGSGAGRKAFPYVFGRGNRLRRNICTFEKRQ